MSSTLQDTFRTLVYSDFKWYLSLLKFGMFSLEKGKEVRKFSKHLWQNLKTLKSFCETMF